MMGDTFGGVVGPRFFEEFCVPYMRRFVERMRPAGILTYIHICGNSTRLFELMADTGTNCIEPLDPLGGVSVADAKRRVGHRVALMGGVHTVKLAHGSLREVEEDCARCIREGAPGGGYILACGDMLPTETAPEKVRAMMNAAETIGRYDV
jgi:uroporphyrinogen decarboxylase